MLFLTKNCMVSTELNESPKQSEIHIRLVSKEGDLLNILNYIIPFVWKSMERFYKALLITFIFDHTNTSYFCMINTIKWQSFTVGLISFLLLACLCSQASIFQ